MNIPYDKLPAAPDHYSRITGEKIIFQEAKTCDVSYCAKTGVKTFCICLDKPLSLLSRILGGDGHNYRAYLRTKNNRQRFTVEQLDSISADNLEWSDVLQDNITQESSID